MRHYHHRYSVDHPPTRAFGPRRISPILSQPLSETLNDAIYVVAEADPTKAVDIIRRNVAGPNVELEDLGRVSDKLLVALALQPGQFTRT